MKVSLYKGNLSQRILLMLIMIKISTCTLSSFIKVSLYLGNISQRTLLKLIMIKMSTCT